MLTWTLWLLNSGRCYFIPPAENNHSLFLSLLSSFFLSVLSLPPPSIPPSDVCHHCWAFCFENPHWERTLCFRRIKQTQIHRRPHTQTHKDTIHNCSAESERGERFNVCVCVSLAVCVPGDIIHHSYLHHLSPTRRQRKKAPGKHRHSKQNGEEMKRNPSHIFHWVHTCHNACTHAHLRSVDSNYTTETRLEHWKTHQIISGRRNREKRRGSAMF